MQIRDAKGLSRLFHAAAWLRDPLKGGDKTLIFFDQGGGPARHPAGAKEVTTLMEVLEVCPRRYQPHLLRNKCKLSPKVRNMNGETLKHSWRTLTLTSGRAQIRHIWCPPPCKCLWFFFSEISIRDNSRRPFLSELHRSLESAYFLLWPVVTLVEDVKLEAAQMSQ